MGTTAENRDELKVEQVVRYQISGNGSSRSEVRRTYAESSEDAEFAEKRNPRPR
jgi:hypothetical protein